MNLFRSMEIAQSKLMEDEETVELDTRLET